MSTTALIQTLTERTTAAPLVLDHAALKATWTKFDKQRRAAQSEIETVRIAKPTRGAA